MVDYIKAIEQEQLRSDLPNLAIGDYVRVHLKVREGARERIQVFEGTIIARRGEGLRESITVRRLSYGVGVERVLPLHSPKISKIDIVRRGKVRRAKLYYLRGRVGKAAKVKERLVLREDRLAEAALAAGKAQEAEAAAAAAVAEAAAAAEAEAKAAEAAAAADAEAAVEAKAAEEIAEAAAVAEGAVAMADAAPAVEAVEAAAGEAAEAAGASEEKAADEQKES